MNVIIRKALSEITVSEGWRDLDHAWVRELADSIDTIGLLHPIAVDKSGRLVSGGHRLEAYKLLGCNEIECIVLDCDEMQFPTRIGASRNRSPLKKLWDK